MSRKFLAILASALSAVGPAHALMAGYRDLPDQTVQTPLGPITVTHLRYISQGGVYTLRGNAGNGTGHDWNELVLGVTLTDSKGTVLMHSNWGEPSLPKLYIHLQGFQTGGTQEFKFSPFSSPDKNSVVPTITYENGEFPVTYRVGLAKPVAASVPIFETDGYSITFAVQDKALHFSLRNKGDVPIRIDWNSVAYVDPAGQSQGVIHNGVKLADRTAPKAPTIIPPGASVEDDIVPVNNVEWAQSDWVTHALLPTGPAALKLVGSQFSVFLPLDIDGRIENRSFAFKIVGVN